MGIDFRKHYPSTMPRGDVYEGDWVCSEDAEDWPCSFMSALLARAAIADELAVALRWHYWLDPRWGEMWHKGIVRPDECGGCAALAKWEASRAK